MAVSCINKACMWN